MPVRLGDRMGQYATNCRSASDPTYWDIVWGLDSGGMHAPARPRRVQAPQGYSWSHFIFLLAHSVQLRSILRVEVGLLAIMPSI